jgi:hypothetical protein
MSYPSIIQGDKSVKRSQQVQHSTMEHRKFGRTAAGRVEMSRAVCDSECIDAAHLGLGMHAKPLSVTY